jgi:hypothetical protein
MKPGPKPQPLAVQKARGTVEPWRDGDKVQIVTTDDPPSQPEIMTAEVQAMWQEQLPRVMQAGAVELDSELFSTYCHVAVALRKCWTAGEVPPASHLTEFRRLSELLGIAGPKSRVGRAPPSKPAGNPFSKRR